MRRVDSPRGRGVLQVVPRGIALLVIVGLLSSVAPAKAIAASTASDRPIAPSYTGEEIFRGLMWGDGAIMRAHPELLPHSIQVVKPSSGTSDAQLELAKNLVIAKLREADPKFFERMAADLQSGNRVRISAELDDMGVALKRALTSTNDPQRFVYSQFKGQCDFLAVAVVLAAVVNWVVAVTNVYLWVNSSDDEGVGATSRLAHDRFADTIARSLSHSTSSAVAATY